MSFYNENARIILPLIALTTPLLIIDDNPIDVTTYRRYLSEEDYDIKDCETIEDALDELEHNIPPCILLDYSLPDGTGLDFLEEFKERFNSNLPSVIMVTGQGDENIAVQSMKAGARDYLVKGTIDSVNLNKAISQAIEHNQLENLLEIKNIELEASNTELKRLLGELSHFTYLASHDLQEPLRKIQSFSNQLRKHCCDELGERGLDYLQRMESSSQRMKKLLVDLIEYSRISNQDLEFENIDLNKFIESVLKDTFANSNKKDVNIPVHCPLGLNLKTKKVLLHIIIKELINNACTFVLENKKIEISIHVETNNNSVEISITDNGIGFEIDFFERILEPFQRLHSRGQYGTGSGIGLALCKKAVTSLKGFLKVDSTPGEGSTFTFYLPVL